MSQRERGPLDDQFERGYVPGDEPPGIEEHEYRRWKAAGGQVLPAFRPLPAELEALKAQARKVNQEAGAVATEETLAHWKALTDAAGAALAAVWDYVIQERPRTFDAATIRVELELRIPGHRSLWVPFDFDSHFRNWGRSWYPGAQARDANHARAYFMVDVAPGKQLPTYYYALGAALVAAEEGHRP